MTVLKTAIPKRAGRSISTSLSWRPRAAQRCRPDPLFLLAGGPGQAAVEVYPNAAFLFEEVNRTRDIVLVDQRGAGDSTVSSATT